MGTIALLGRPNVGKSTLLNALLGEPIAITSHHPQTTRDRIAGIVTRDEMQFVFLDTPGLHAPKNKLGERMNHLAKATASDCDVVLFMADVDARDGREARVAPQDETIVKSIPETKPTILLLNKVDRITPRSNLLPFLTAYGALRDFAAVIPISALKSDGVERLLGEIGKLLPESEHAYAADELSDKPVRFFVAEFVREQILRRTRQEVPHGVAVTVESFEEGKGIVRIGVTVHVAKDSHKAILIGDGGQMLAAIGTAARRRAETMLGTRVHLQTWIRTTAGWFDDTAKLDELGYAEDREARAKRRKADRAKGKDPRAKGGPAKGKTGRAKGERARGNAASNSSAPSKSAPARQTKKAPKEAGGSGKRPVAATKTV